MQYCYFVSNQLAAALRQQYKHNNKLLAENLRDSDPYEHVETPLFDELHIVS